MNKEKLFNRNFLLLFQGQVVSTMGSSAYSLAFLFWMKQATNSPSLMGLLGMAAMLPALILGPFGGALADHFSRKKIIVCCDLISGAVVCSTALIMLNFPDRLDWIIPMLFCGAVVNGATMSVFRPAVSALIPDLVPLRRLAMANGLIQNAFMIVAMVGQAVGGVLYRVLGAPLLMLLDGVSYLLSALSESFIEEPRVVVSHDIPWKDLLRKLKRDTVEGFRFVHRKPGLKALLLFFSLQGFFLAPMGVMLPFFVENTLGATVDWFGYMMAGAAFGALCGGMMGGFLPIKAAVRSKLVLTGLVVVSLLFMSFGYSSTPLLAVGVQFLIGLIMGAFGVLLTLVMQLGTPANFRGRVFGLMGTLTGALAPISLGLSGLFIELLDRDMPLIFVICGGSMLVCVPIIAFNRGFHQLMATEVAAPDLPDSESTMTDTIRTAAEKPNI